MADMCIMCPVQPARVRSRGAGAAIADTVQSAALTRCIHGRWHLFRLASRLQSWLDEGHAQQSPLRPVGPNIFFNGMLFRHGSCVCVGGYMWYPLAALLGTGEVAESELEMVPWVRMAPPWMRRT